MPGAVSVSLSQDFVISWTPEGEPGESVALELTDDSLEAIADLAMERGTGARGLRSILENVLLEPMFDVPGRSDVMRCVVSAESVRDKLAPTYEMRKATRTRRAS